MKPFFGILILLSIGTIRLHGQFWNTFSHPKATYYSLNQDTALVWNFKTDLDTLINGDSVFALPPYFEHCTNCPNPNCPSTDTMAIKQDAFLANSVFRISNSDWIFGTRHVLLKNTNTLNTPWLADTAYNLSCELRTIRWENVLGNFDSIRVYQLSNGDSIRIGKKYGLLHFPYLDGSGNYLHIAGVRDDSLGHYFPSFENLIDWESGDVFYYEYDWTIYPCNGNGKIRYDILSQTTSPDSIFYQVLTSQSENSICYYTQQGNPTYHHENQYISTFRFAKKNIIGNVWYQNPEIHPDTYIDSIEPNIGYCDQFATPDKLYRTQPFQFQNREGVLLQNLNYSGYSIQTLMDSTYLFDKTGFYFNCYPSNSYMQYAQNSEYYTLMTQAAGIGIVKAAISYIDVGHSMELKGYQKNGIPTGNLPSTSSILSNEAHLTVSSPGYFYVSQRMLLATGFLPEEFPIHLSLLDISGRAVFAKPFPENGTLELPGGLHAGIYILQQTSANGLTSAQKILLPEN